MLRKKHLRRLENIWGFSFVICVLIIFGALLVNFANVGGEALLDSACEFFAETANLRLTAKNISGNPIKGYVLKDVILASSDSENVLTVSDMNCELSFRNLLTGKFAFSHISLDGVEFVFENLAEKLGKVRENLSERKSDSKSGFSIAKARVEKLRISGAKIVSKFGTFTADDFRFDTQLLDAKFRGRFNGVNDEIEIDGVADLDRTSSELAINRADVKFGNGRILATGGILRNNSQRIFDLHGSVHNLDLKQLTSIWDNLDTSINSSDFDGIVNLNLDVGGSIDNPVFSGTGDFRGKKISGFPVDSFSANFEYANHNLTIDNIQAYALNVPINGEILMRTSDFSKPKFEISLEGNETTLDDLYRTLNPNVKLNLDLRKLRGVINSINVKLKGDSEIMTGLVNFYGQRVFYDGNVLRDIRAQMKFTRSSDALVSGKFKFEGSQGYIQGSVKSFFANPECDLVVKILDLEFEKLRRFVQDYDEHKIPEKVSALFNVKGELLAPEISGEFSRVSQVSEDVNLPFRISESKITFVNKL